MLRSKAKLAQKRYEIVALRVSTTKSDMKKAKKTKKKIVAQNASICTGMKIEGIFWLSALAKTRRSLSLVIEVHNAKIANFLIEKKLVLEYILYKCIRYNLTCRIKQYFNCYKYGHV